MDQLRKTDANKDFTDGSNPRKPLIAAVTQFKAEEKKRWKRRYLSLIFVGLLISVLIHLNIAFILQISSSDGGRKDPSGAITTIEFAILEEETFTDLPEGDNELVQDSEHSQANADILDSTSAALEPSETRSSIQQNASTMTPSLAGGGSAGMGSGIGGSGGAGASFFGIASAGSRFCYIVDVSGSMAGARLSAALAELTDSIKKLPDFSRFYVLFFSSGYQEPASQHGWNTARSSTVRNIVREIQNVRSGGSTEPSSAFEKAFELEPPPDVIFLLTDGQLTGFNIDNLLSLIPKRTRVTINTIAFGTDAKQPILREIANETGGQFKFVKLGGKP
ncbi:MAG: vWA domain-containing protein [Phycisphaerales bacterium]|jgi:hypothetical protein|nr:vWA domain-containing protein [Phycisphaerales bacterium]